MKLRPADIKNSTNLNWFFILPITFVFATSGFTAKKEVSTPCSYAQSGTKSPGEDTVQSVRYINTSSLERLPGVIRDLSTAINESGFIKELLGDNGLSVYLYDITCKRFGFSAAVHYNVYDSIYRVKINSINRRAMDIALAATLIHETMHCVLLNLNDRARWCKSRAIINVLNIRSEDRDGYGLSTEFFDLMNMGESGQHELMYRLLYPKMTELLKRFAEIHNIPLRNENAEFLMWSGLQNTEAYKRLANKERQKIETAIVMAKGMDFEEDLDLFE